MIKKKHIEKKLPWSTLYGVWKWESHEDQDGDGGNHW